ALIYPLFICPGEGVRKEVSSMPGVFNLSIDEAVKEAESCAALGLGGLLLFGLPAEKDVFATGAYSEQGIVQQALRALKASRACDPLVLIADVCLCEYTSHGHCGIVVNDSARGPEDPARGLEDPGHYHIDNDSTLPLLARTAVSLAAAGPDTPIMSYASKCASAFYGPFREAADSAPQFGDRRSYQMDGANIREAM